MVGFDKQITDSQRETSAKLPVNFQAPLLSVGQLAVMLHASIANAASSIQKASACQLDGSFVHLIISAC